eukprot:5571409-Prymnesium_polylepis.1
MGAAASRAEGQRAYGGEEAAAFMARERELRAMRAQKVALAQACRTAAHGAMEVGELRAAASLMASALREGEGAG